VADVQWPAAGGRRFAFVAFNAIGESPRATPRRPGVLSVRMPPRTGPLVRDDLDHVKRVIRRADRRADAVVVLERPVTFQAVGEWYVDFTQVEDADVRALLKP
jgi:hypothetical protein